MKVLECCGNLIFAKYRTRLVEVRMAYRCLFFTVLVAYSVVKLVSSTELVSIDDDIPSPKECSGELYQCRPPEDSFEIVIPAFFAFPDENETMRENVWNGHLVIPAALLALDEINNMTGLLPGYHLTLDILDSSCDRYTGVHELICSLESKTDDSPRLAILGPGCPEVSEEIARVAWRYNLPQVSYGYNSPSLSDREQFPSFFQTVRSFDTVIKTALLVLDHFKWTNHIAIIYQADEVYTTTVEKLVTPALSGNFTIEITDLNVEVNIPVFEEIQPISPSHFMEEVRNSYIRVIMGLVNDRFAYQLLCEAIKGTIPGSGFVWVFVGTFRDTWWMDSDVCNLTKSDVESVLIISPEVENVDTTSVLDTSGKTFTEFKSEYIDRLHEWCPDAEAEPLAAATYDSLWAIAFAINETIASTTTHGLNESYYSHPEVVYNGILDGLNAVNFTGASGMLQFSNTGGRIGVDVIYQIQDGIPRPVGFYDTELNFDSLGYSIRWPGNSTTPADTVLLVHETVPLWLLVTGSAVTLAGAILSIAMFYFNWSYGKHRILRAASQQLSYIIIVGTWLAYLSVFILSILESELGQMMGSELFAVLCVVRLSALAIGFTLAYGTMFARAWRIYRIFNDPWVVNRPLRDCHLMGIVAVLVVGDLIILVVWSAIDYYRRFPSFADIDYEDYSRCMYVACSSTYVLYWLAIIGLYKILLMLGGSFVVSLVRKGVVERKIYDDSKALSVALYVTAIAFIAGLLLLAYFLLQLNVILVYVVSATWVNISATGTIICVFLPKFWAVVIKKEAGKEVKSFKSVFYVAHPSCKQDDTLPSCKLDSLLETSTTVIDESHFAPAPDYRPNSLSIPRRFTPTPDYRPNSLSIPRGRHGRRHVKFLSQSTEKEEDTL